MVEWRGTPNRSIWSYDVADDGTVGNKTKLIDAADQGALDGFRVDRDGNLWCGWGSNGALQEAPSDIGGRKVFQLRGKPEDLDGVMVFNPQGKPIGVIRLPERCANLTFGGPENNRLYMASLLTRSMPSMWSPTARPEPISHRGSELLRVQRLHQRGSPTVVLADLRDERREIGAATASFVEFGHRRQCRGDAG